MCFRKPANVCILVNTHPRILAIFMYEVVGHYNGRYAMPKKKKRKKKKARQT